MADLVTPAPLSRRLLAAVYDLLLLLGVFGVLTAVLAIGSGFAGAAPAPRVLLAIYWLVAFLFFAWFWTHGGQTLGMRAWRLKVRRVDGSRLHWPAACWRYAAAWLSWAPLGLGVAWCLIDPRRRAWHDALSDTEVVLLPKEPTET